MKILIDISESQFADIQRIASVQLNGRLPTVEQIIASGELIVNSQPTIEPKKGKWIVYYECPRCGEITKDFTEYCPFCGADTREGDTE